MAIPTRKDIQPGMLVWIVKKHNQSRTIDRGGGDAAPDQQPHASALTGCVRKRPVIGSTPHTL